MKRKAAYFNKGRSTRRCRSVAGLLPWLLLIVFSVSGCAAEKAASAPAEPESLGAEWFVRYYTRKAAADELHDYSRMRPETLSGMAAGAAAAAADAEELTVEPAGTIVSGNTAEIALLVTVHRLDSLAFDNGTEHLKNYRFGDEIFSLAREGFEQLSVEYLYCEEDDALAPNQLVLHYRLVSAGPFEKDAYTIVLNDFGYYDLSRSGKLIPVIEGTWQITVPLAPAADAGRTVPVKKALTAGQYGFSLEEVRLTPLACTLRLRFDGDPGFLSEQAVDLQKTIADGAKSAALTFADGTSLEHSGFDVSFSFRGEKEAWLILSFFGPIDAKSVTALSVFDSELSLA